MPSVPWGRNRSGTVAIFYQKIHKIDLQCIGPVVTTLLINCRRLGRRFVFKRQGCLGFTVDSSAKGLTINLFETQDMKHSRESK